MDEGWQWMGDNNMFFNGSKGTDDASIIENNKNLLTGGIQTQVIYSKNNSNPSIKTSALFKGDNAKSFMSVQGYEVMPLESVSTEISYTLQSPSGPWSTSTKVGEEEWTRITYQQKNAVYKTKTEYYLGSPFDPQKDIHREYTYVGSNRLLPILETLNKGGEIYNNSFKGYHDYTIYKEGWKNYPKNGHLRKYKKKK